MQNSEKRPFFRRPWFVGVVVLLGLGALTRERGERGERARPSAATAAPVVMEAEPDAAPEEPIVPEAAAAEAAEAVVVASAAASEPRRKWQYRQREDAMTGQVTRFAEIRSENAHEFDFPYQGGSWADLTLRRHPRHGVDVLVSVTKGQILCMSFSGCTVMVRFDDLPPIRLRGGEPADHDSKMLFLSPSAKFIKAAKRAKKAAIELNFYSEGSRVFLFDVEGLVWE